MESSKQRSKIDVKSTVLDWWCRANGFERPTPPELRSANKLARALLPPEKSTLKCKIKEEESEKESSVSVSEEDNVKTPVSFSNEETELNPRSPHFYTSSDEAVSAAMPESPSSSSSSNNVIDESLNSMSTEEEEEIVVKLRSSQVFEQEESVISLRNITRTNADMRVPLCTSRLLSVLKPLLTSRYSVIQINAVASLVNLSLEKVNKVKIVRVGIVPPLIDVLKGGFPEAQEHAAGALFSLALDNENKVAIGVLGALPPLFHMLRSGSERGRQDSALALYHLSLVQSNRSKLVKLGCVRTLLAMARRGDLARRVILILCNLAKCAEGKTALLDANAVECFVRVLRENKLNSETVRENCVEALYALSKGSLRFKGLAEEAGAIEVLREVEERGSERARERAWKILHAYMTVIFIDGKNVTLGYVEGLRKPAQE